MSFSNADTSDKPADPYKKANADEVSLDQKISDFKSFIEATKFVMMTTKTPDGKLASRAMALAATESGGIDFIFHTNTESGKTDDISNDSQINLSAINPSGEWASVAGKASIETDRDLVKKYYSDFLKTWVGDLGDGVHDGSANDPRIGIIRVKMETATYSLVAKNILSRSIEVVQGALTGKPAAINKLREISESEVSTWRTTH